MDKELKVNNPIDTDPDPSPKPGATRLRVYWTRGKGAAKIRWGVSGDFNRCVKHLRKYVTDPKGLCNVYHVAATGFPPGKGHGGGKDLDADQEMKETLIFAQSLKQLDCSPLLNLLNDIQETKDDMQPDLEHKQLTNDSPAVGLTEVKEDGVVEALVSVTGIEDNVKDIIIPGAYTKTLQERTPKGVWAHDWNTPVSKVLDIKELMPGDPNLPKTLANGEAWPAEAGALYVKAQFNLGTQRGRDAFSDVEFYKDQAEWSIGYNVPKGKSEKNEQGVRLIKELNLFEYSPVLFGAASNARSLVSAAKSLFDSEEEFRKEFKDILDDDGDVETEITSETPDETPAEVVDEATDEEVCPKCGHTEETEKVAEELDADVADNEPNTVDEAVEKSEARAEDTEVPLTAEAVEQIKSLHDQLGSILSLITVTPVKPVFSESKTMRDAVEALVKGTGDSGIIQAISENIEELETAIKTMDQEAIQDNANDALDEITFALQDPKTDEKTAEELKALVAAIGEALAGLEKTPAPADNPGTPITPETVVQNAGKSVEISATEWKSLLAEINGI